MKYLVNVLDGTIYEWHPVLAENPKCREISEELAFPERFIPAAQRGRKPKVNMTTDEVPADEDTSNAELSADASRGLPK